MAANIELRGKRSGWCKGLAIVLACCVASSPVWAASAFAYDSAHVVFGHGTGQTVAKAKERARADCIANGGTNGTVEDFTSTVLPGWGAACISEQGNGRRISAVVGYPTKQKAKRRAKRLCKESGGINCQIVDIVHDNG